MRTVSLGSSGLVLPALVAGAARGPVPVARGVDLLHEAWELGIRGIEVTDPSTAAETSAERFLQDRQPEDAVVLAPVGVAVDPERGSDLSPERIARGLSGRVRRLGRLDAAWVRGTDEDTPPEATVAALADGLEAGTVRTWGAGEADVRRLEAWLTAADAAGLPRPSFVRTRWSLVERGVERDLLALAAGEGVAVLVAGALGRGRLTDRHIAEEEAADRAVAAGTPRAEEADPLLPALVGLREVAREHDATTSAVALAWLLGHPAGPAVVIPAVPGAEWDAAAEALQADLDEEERERISDLFG